MSDWVSKHPIVLENVYFKRYIREVNIHFEEKLIHCIVGPNGSGKTTLLRLLVGLIKPSKGNIRVLGLDPFKYRGRFNNEVVAILEPQRLPSSVTVFEYLKHVASLCNADLKRLLELAEIFNLTRYMNFFIDHLSSGNIKKLLLLQSISINPDVLILDEPTMHLDIDARMKTLDLLKKLKDGGTTIIISSHAFHDMEKIGDKIYIMSNGRIISSGFLSTYLEKYAVAFSKKKPELRDESLYLTYYSGYYKIVGLKDFLTSHGFEVNPPSLTDIYEYMLYGGVRNKVSRAL